jgi:cytidine deaminase
MFAAGSPSEALIARAREAGHNAYCPYSKFRVGAAVEDETGRVWTGANVENASYGLAMCAERVALFAAVSAGAGKFCRVAVACLEGDPGQPGTLMPCGACRQVMAEFMRENAEVLVDGVGAFELAQLLPVAFRLKEGAGV